MTMDPHNGETNLAGAGRSSSHRHRFATVGMALGLSAAVAFTGACSRKNTPNIDPALKTWFEKSFLPASNDMAKAAGEAKGLKEGCQAASDALTTHEAKLTNTPDAQLTELVKGFVAERKEAYAKCVETGETPAPSAKVSEIQKRINELTSKGRPG